MIHNKQYYIDKYDKAWNKVKSEIEKRGEDPEVVGVTDEWEQNATPEEIVGYYIETHNEDLDEIFDMLGQETEPTKRCKVTVEWI